MGAKTTRYPLRCPAFKGVKMKQILVTGAAGFIGAHLSHALLKRGHQLTGLDNLNDYYSTQLKRDRLAYFCKHPDFRFVEMDIASQSALDRLFDSTEFDYVIHLAAQAGVRYSLENPYSYAQSNLNGFVNLIEACRQHSVKHLVFASSSSVYGQNTISPFSESAAVDHPISLYAASKRANELIAHSYAHLYQLPCTGLRFFTVYGPWGRPDMAPMLFADAITHGRPINVFNHGDMLRDFTYIDDIVDGVIAACNHIPEPTSQQIDNLPHRSHAQFALYNLGQGQPVVLMDFIHAIETHLGIKAEIIFKPMQPGDMQSTYADTQAARTHLGFTAKASLDTGIKRFIDWYRGYYY